MPTLFPEPIATRNGPLGVMEPYVRWFTESTRPEAIASREVVNAWYRDFPDVDERFAARVRSEIDIDHKQALDELYVHSLLRARYADVRYEVGGVGPDFRLYAGGRCVGGVEVLSIFQREDWTREEQQHGRLTDEINRRIRPTAGYFVDFEIDRADQEPPPRRVADFLTRELARLPPHEEFGSATQLHDLPTATYDRDGVLIRIRFIPMTANAPTKTDPDGRIVGTGAMVGGMSNLVERLRDRIAAKAGGRYEIADVPFVVAVGMHDFLSDDHELLAALYGRDAIRLPSRVPFRQNDGLFGADRERPEGRHRRVSSVVVTSGLRPWLPDEVDTSQFDNPFAARPTPEAFLPVKRRFGKIADDTGTVRYDWVTT